MPFENGAKCLFWVQHRNFTRDIGTTKSPMTTVDTALESPNTALSNALRIIIDIVRRIDIVCPAPKHVFWNAPVPPLPKQ